MDEPRESREPREPREPRESRHRPEKYVQVSGSTVEEATDYMALLSNKYVMIALVVIAIILFVTYYMYKELTNIKQYIYQQNLANETNKTELEQIDQKINKITSVFKSITQNTQGPIFKQQPQQLSRPIEEDSVEDEEDPTETPEINIL